MARKKHDSGKDSFDLIPEKMNKLHDDRAYCAAMTGWALSEERRKLLLQKPKTSSNDILSKLTSQIDNKDIKEMFEQINSIDKEASQFVIDREFSVFSFYAANNLPEMYDAWVRFYRLLARDSMERVKKVSFDIYSALREDCEKKDSASPEAALAQTLLYWSQDFHYERKSSSYDKADIESIPAILEGGSSDCDGRSLLLMCILKNCSLDSCMFISAQYSHALLGVYLPGKQGQTIKVDDNEGGKDYIVGETTAKNLTLGMISASMTDRKNWMSVELP